MSVRDDDSLASSPRPVRAVTRSPSSVPSAQSRVAVIMGSDSDLPTMEPGAAILRELGVDVEVRVLSAHRTPLEMVDFAQKARGQGFGVIVAGAGGAAHLPGMVAALTTLPVIGVPAGDGPTGLPVGIQLIGFRYDDDALLDVAAAAAPVVDPWHGKVRVPAG